MSLMKILVIGNDPKIFDRATENFRRIQEYAMLFDELHIVSVARQEHEAYECGKKLFLWPACAYFPLTR